MEIKPDYRRLLKTIRHEEPDRVPLAEFQVDTPVMDQFMGRPVRDVEDRIAFQAAAGFDFIYLRANYDYPGMSPAVSTGTPRSWLDTIDWPNPDTVDVSHMETAAQVLPPGFGIITGVGGVFTRTWMLMGYEHFCMSLADNPELVAQAS
jgi:uroporphyrinogen decarboxylase